MSNAIKEAGTQDAAAIASIYNQGIEDRGATFETHPRSAEDIAGKLAERERNPLLVITEDDVVIGWASLSSYRPRECYAGIAEFSIYLDRGARGRGLGRQLLTALIDVARDRGYWKLVSRIFPLNVGSRALCRSCGFREVGVYENHSRLDGQWRDVVIVERLIPENVTSKGVFRPYGCYCQLSHGGFSMMKLSVTALALTFSIAALWAQDPLTVLPDSYAKQFENEWVRVVRVRYAPHAKLPAHAHNALPAAYVYLNDGGPVLFKHIGASYGAATRPATKAGSFRVFRGIDEIHEVENTSELPSDFLRVEFKTESKDVRTLKGRYFRPAAPHGQNVEQLQFENDQVRITHVICAPGRSIRIAAAATEPSLLIAFQAAQLRDQDSDVTMRVGQERWIPAGSTVTFDNVGSQTSEFLRFDFKTQPIASSH